MALRRLWNSLWDCGWDWDILNKDIKIESTRCQWAATEEGMEWWWWRQDNVKDARWHRAGPTRDQEGGACNGRTGTVQKFTQFLRITEQMEGWRTLADTLVASKRQYRLCNMVKTDFTWIRTYATKPHIAVCTLLPWLHKSLTLRVLRSTTNGVAWKIFITKNS